MTTSARLRPWLTTTTVSVIASGAVGPEIIVRVPPTSATTNPRAMAPYSPAIAPNPDATP